MAYTDQRTGRNQRAAVMGIVAVIQGAVIVALINGLAVHWRAVPQIPNPKASEVPITMPVDIPPPPPKRPIEQKVPIDQPLPKVPLGESTDRPLPPVPIPSDPVPTRTYDPPPQPKPPVFEARAPKPKNAPGSWATPNDYPARDLREGNQGVTGFALTVGADGRVQSCTVTASSGFPGLDKATCDNVSRRARFEPATDGSGNRTTGTYSSRIHWQIPQG